MSLPLSDSEQNLFESFNALPVEAGTPRDENIRLNEERSIIASTIALHGVQVYNSVSVVVSYRAASLKS